MAMGFVETVYTNTTSFLDNVQESQFGQVADSITNTASLLATLMAIIVIINMGTQVYKVDVGPSIWFIFKLVLVALFMRNWDQFNAVTSAFFAALDGIAGALIASVGGATSGEEFKGYNSFAEAFDKMTASISKYANVTAGYLNILGAVINGIMMLLMGIFGAIAAFIMVASRVVITVLIGLAPLAIMCTLSGATKTYFEKWLSALVTMALYPVIIAGVFSTILGIVFGIVSNMGDPDSITKIGDIVPLVMVIILAIGLIGAVPMIVGAISGNFFMKEGFTERLGGAANKLAGGAGRAGAGAAARGAGGVAANTAGFMRNPVQNTRDAAQMHASSLSRVAERVARFRN